MVIEGCSFLRDETLVGTLRPSSVASAPPSPAPALQRHAKTGVGMRGLSQSAWLVPLPWWVGWAESHLPRRCRQACLHDFSCLPCPKTRRRGCGGPVRWVEQWAEGGRLVGEQVGEWYGPWLHERTRAPLQFAMVPHW